MERKMFFNNSGFCYLNEKIIGLPKQINLDKYTNYMANNNFIFYKKVL